MTRIYLETWDRIFTELAFGRHREQLPMKEKQSQKATVNCDNYGKMPLSKPTQVQFQGIRREIRRQPTQALLLRTWRMLTAVWLPVIIKYCWYDSILDRLFSIQQALHTMLKAQEIRAAGGRMNLKSAKVLLPSVQTLEWLTHLTNSLFHRIPPTLSPFHQWRSVHVLCRENCSIGHSKHEAYHLRLSVGGDFQIHRHLDRYEIVLQRTASFLCIFFCQHGSMPTPARRYGHFPSAWSWADLWGCSATWVEIVSNY